VDRNINILTGYTAVGKTRLSLNWAVKHDAEIISCDSLLFYRHMNIGTAKPTRAELEEVPHHLIDVVDPSDQYSVDKYLNAAMQAVSDIHGRGKRVLVVGGSGFYLQAFFGPVVDDVKIDPQLELDIVSRFENQPLSESVEILSAMNPQGLEGLDVDNPRRVLKAWLRCAASGKSILELREAFEAKAGPFDGYERELLVLTRPRAILEERVRKRVDEMLAVGLLEEVRQLMELGIDKNPSAAGSIGYREPIACIRGQLSEDNLAESISVNTRKLLKKQRTWFKKFLPSEAVLDVTELTELPELWYRFPARRFPS
jgi:tRNA dimethylallyltransferase